MTNQTKAMLAAIIANVIFGFSFLASKVALNEVSPLILLTTRFAVAFMILNLLVVLRVSKINLKRKNIKPLLLLGVIQPVIYFLCENYGIQYTTSSFSGVMIALIPVMAFFLAHIMLKENFRMKQLLWAISSVIGVCIISLAGNGDGEITRIGVILLILAVISAAFYNIVSRQCAEKFTAFERTYVMFAVGSVAFTIITIVQTKGTMGSILLKNINNMSFILPVLFLAIMSSVIAFLLLNYAITYLPVRRATSFASLTTVVSILVGIIFLKETFGLIQMIGSVIIIIGVYKVNTEVKVEEVLGLRQEPIDPKTNDLLKNK